MRVSFVSQQPGVIFRLDDVDPRLEASLRSAFWQPIDSGWQRDYPADAPLVDRVTETFAANAERMFRQLAGLDPVPWENALHAWIERAGTAGIRWCLTGSGATALRVADVVPHDLDIMIQPGQVDLVRTMFADVLIEPLVETDGWIMRSFGVLFLHARIDIAVDPVPAVDRPEPVDFGPYAAAHLETVSWRGHSVLVPPLALQAAVNRRRGRHERAARIEAALAGQERGFPEPVDP